MTFSMLCVCIVVIVAILGFTALLCYLIYGCTTDDMFMIGWIINGVCFGICFTILLYQNGLL